MAANNNSVTQHLADLDVSEKKEAKATAKNKLTERA
jgi:hypothetical protein